jgi:hypothetical protein
MREIAPLWIRWPYARVRREREIVRGEVRYFVSQLEYNVAATPAGGTESDWRVVARFDHNADPDRGHDIRMDGLHLDVYKDGEKYKIKTGFPPVSPTTALNFCDQFFEQNADQLLEQFERWHGLYGPWRDYSSE